MRKFYVSVLSMIALLFFSCQSEENTTVQDPNGSITKNSPLALLMSRVSQNETFVDNVLDNTSCLSVGLPVTIYVNNQQMVVYTQEDFNTVEGILNASSTDEDIVEFVYPITVT